jgi:microcompartment protein CcmL/EutN
MPLAVGMVEFKSVAQGIMAADAMVKAASVQLLHAAPICPGKYVAIVGGEVAAVQSSVNAGVSAASAVVVDTLVIPNAHEDLFPALSATTEVERVDALGIIETFSVASGIVAADLAAKAAEVKLIEIRIARGLGGKAFVLLTGSVSAVRAAVEAGARYAIENGQLVDSQVIPSPHPDLIPNIL